MTNRFDHTQALTFLIRDWPNKHVYDFGMDGGKEYLDDVLRKLSGKMKHFDHYLQESFEKTNCCLLPRPGDDVAECPPSHSVTYGGKSTLWQE